ncbi:MAG: hypothetical protein O4859_30925 [Trichodesmium sp. St18_bin1]|nr:hypothetical protein [Trichodesmium sp. St18_bin1]
MPNSRGGCQPTLISRDKGIRERGNLTVVTGRIGVAKLPNI